jgi:ADP-heptose:LPS heptosyltransferase
MIFYDRSHRSQAFSPSSISRHRADLAGSHTVSMKPIEASDPASATPPSCAGNYKTEIVRGPRGPLAIYDFAFDSRGGRRLLVLKLDHYGDFVIGLPALKRLREAFASDHITLVCGSWNVDLARRLDVADDVRSYNFFPENSALWNGQPFESVQRFCEVCRGSFDIAIDLRVDEDTRFLLDHVDAGTRCGIGLRARHPFLDIVLPPPFERRESAGGWISLDPDQFESRMPVRTPFYHENDFSVTDMHLVYGPYITLPEGTFRAHYGLRLLGFSRSPGVETSIDVTRGAGSDIIAVTQVMWTDRGDPHAAEIEFLNDDPSTSYEFRVHTRGHPTGARLRFFGVRLERIGGSTARLKPAELHVGEQLSLLVNLVEQRTREVYRDDLLPQITVPYDSPGVSEAGAGVKQIVISPLSNSQVRDWGITNYSRIIALLLERIECCVILVGSKAQKDFLERIVDENGSDRRIINLAGIDWSETTAIVRAANLVIANNSGVAHLAAASGRPTLAIYSGSHQPQEWGPRGNNVRVVMAMVPCSPCGHDRIDQCSNDHQCMKQIAPETIADQAVALLSGLRHSASMPSAIST